MRTFLSRRIGLFGLQRSSLGAPKWRRSGNSSVFNRLSSWTSGALLILAAAPVLSQLCGGDCGGDGAVAINELITCVNVALGGADGDVCAACDANADGKVAINELIGAVNHALEGCPEPVLPDLAPVSASAGSPATMCGDDASATLRLVVCVANHGGAAGPFAVDVRGREFARLADGLGAGEERCVEGAFASGDLGVVVDAGEEVEESNEDNNRAAFVVAVPTPRPTCTPTVTATPGVADSPTPTPTVSATGTRTAAATPTAPNATPASSGTATASTIASHTASRTRSGTPGMEPRGAFRAVAMSAQGATRLAVLGLDWFALLDEVVAQTGVNPAGLCPGAVTDTCAPSAGSSVQTIDYDDCATTTANGHRVVRRGRITRTIGNAHFCQDGVVGAADTDAMSLQGYEQTETMGDATLTRMAATLTIERAGQGQLGCAGVDAIETLSGTLAVQCSAAAESMRCPPRGVDVELTPAGLRRRRESSGTPCHTTWVVDGRMEVSNQATAEVFTETFTALRIDETALPVGGGRAVMINGGFATECLGAVAVSTDAPLVPGDEMACPVSGTLAIVRPGLASPALAAADRAGGVAGVAPIPAAGFQQRLFRAARGQVYQVLQFAAGESENGAEALRITSVVGSLGDGVATCVNTTGASSVPTAVTAAPAGQTFPIDAVFKSPLLPYAGSPCFNRNAAAGNGQLCVGLACTADCGCTAGQQCAAFTLGDDDDPARVPLSTPSGGLPAAARAALSGPAPPCDGFAGREAYRFGAGGPTTDRELCAAVPSDGFTLASGSTVVFAYDTQALQLFNAGAAGLLIDQDGVEPFNCAASEVVLSPGRAAVDTAPAARAQFVAGRLDLYYDDQPDAAGPPDRSLAACDAGARIACEAPPLPTATPDPNRPCGAVVLESEAELTANGSTVGRADSASGASCGWGGGSGAPDIAYEYVAAATGIYDFAVVGADFEPYLYARANSCLPNEPELGCSDDGGGSRDRRISLALAENQRVALIVDGATDEAGDFSIEIHRKQPDLVIRSVDVPPDARAGDRIPVAAEIENRGDGDAGPFRVEFVYASDAAGTTGVSLAPLRCEISGLRAGQRSICTPANELSVPLVAAGSYSIVASVDPNDHIAERDEANNGAVSHSEIAAAAGVTFDQQIFRASDGTVYQLLAAVPQLAPSAAGSFRVTSLAASLATVTACESDVGVLRAAVGSSALLDLSRIRRTGILRPNNFGAPLFDAVGSGRLLLGAGSSVLAVCAQADGCTGAPIPLSELGTAGGGIGAACVATAPTGSYCPGAESIPSTIAFGVQQTGGVCQNGAPRDVGVESAICTDEAALPAGFTLRPGEAIAFVYQAGAGAVEIGAGALVLAREQLQNCTAGQVAQAATRQGAKGAVPVLSVVEVQRGTRPFAVAVTPDGRNVYVAAYTLAAYARSDDGNLEPIAFLSRIEGLDNPDGVALSPDGQHLYVTSTETDAVAVMARDPATGVPTFVEVEPTGVPGLDGGYSKKSVALSPDGLNVYVTSSAGLTVFARDPTSGALSLLAVDESIGGATVTVSPDGRHVYVGLVVFAREPSSGALTFVGFDPTEVAYGVTLSPDGAHVYAVTFLGDVAVFARDAATGLLSEVEVEPFSVSYGLTRTDLTVSADGAQVYVLVSNGIVVFRRDRNTGALEFVQLEDVDRLEGGPRSLSLSPDGHHLYEASADETVKVFSRNTSSGELTLLTSVREGLGPDVKDAHAVSVSPDGRNVYVKAEGLAVFERDAATGRVRFVESFRNGFGGVDGVGGGSRGAVSVSPDGRSVYVAGNGTAVFAREATAGTLTFIEKAASGAGLSVTVSPDGRHVYAGYNALARDAATSALTLIGNYAHRPYLSPRSVAISPDGSHVYFASESNESRPDVIEVFSRDPTTGALSFVQDERVDRFPTSVAVSPDGRHVYETSRNSPMQVFARSSANGRLSIVTDVSESGSGRAVTVSPDGNYVYTGDSDLRVFDRDATSAMLRFAERESYAAFGVAASADGRHVYAATGAGIVAYRTNGN
jgi:6-phosphogluconolactonase (cycloisomerase 2 family)